MRWMIWAGRVMAGWGGLLALSLAGAAQAHETGAPLAKTLFSSRPAASAEPPAPIGSYARGCLAGGMVLAPDGRNYQAMRLSRNRNWGHPDLVRFVQDLAAIAPSFGYNGLLVGDMSQPRGGPMRSGHRSHQIGLDADIWLSPMPDRVLSAREREEMSAVNMVRPDRRDVDYNVWTPAHHALVRAAASDPRVARIFVNAAIKRALCRDETGDRAWLRKVRSWYGHNYHMHVRLACPVGAGHCRNQDPIPPGDGCGEVDWWLSDEVLNPKPDPDAKPKPRKELRLADLPGACAATLQAPRAP